LVSDRQFVKKIFLFYGIDRDVVRPLAAHVSGNDHTARGAGAGLGLAVTGKRVISEVEKPLGKARQAARFCCGV
jgi:hypothetical protein